MTKRISNRDRILVEGLKTVHKLGFGGASVRDIVEAAGVPQGSFTNHFVSKEAFGLEILSMYFERTRHILDATLRNETLPPLDRLRGYLAASRERTESDGIANGCLYGNLAGEAIDHSAALRQRLLDIFGEVRDALGTCLNAAIKAGDLARTINSGQVAEFIVSGQEGAALMSKVQDSTVPLERFEQLLFSMVLGLPELPKRSVRRITAALPG